MSPIEPALPAPATAERAVTAWRGLSGTALAYLLAATFGLLLAQATFPAAFVSSSVDLSLPPEGDMAQHIVGQRYFIADAWRWPVLQTAGLAIPQGVNIGFVDAIPLLALLLKLLQPLLPPGFHGIGLWYALAWVLQPVAAVWCLRGTGERRALPLVVFAVAAASLPAWWNRFGHAALCGHFLLLLALGCYLRLTMRPSLARWAATLLLLVATLLVHPYLAFMATVLIAAVPATLLVRGDPAWRGAVFGVMLGLALLGLAMALLDYLGASGSGGIGLFAMNLLGPIWPYRSSIWLWSLPEVTAAGGNAWEGYNYLGAGLLLGLAAALTRRAELLALVRRHAGLAAALLGLALLSVATRPMLGPLELFDPGPMPAWIENLRSTGRFFWPVAYGLLAGVVLLAARRPDRRQASFLLAAIGVLQFADAAELRHGLRDHIAGREQGWLVPVEEMRPLLAGQESLTLLPSWGCDAAEDSTAEQHLQLQLLLLASESVLPVSTMYVARWHRPPECADEALAETPLGRGELRVLTPDAQGRLLAAVPRADELCRPLGNLVLCRDPAATDPPAMATTVPLAPVRAALTPRSAALALLGSGWSAAGAEGVLAPGGVAEIRGLRDSAWPLQASLELAGEPGRAREVELALDGLPLGRWTLPADGTATRVDLVLPAAAPGPATLGLRLVGMPEGGAAGLRLSHLCLVTLRYRAAADACAG